MPNGLKLAVRTALLLAIGALLSWCSIRWLAYAWTLVGYPRGVLDFLSDHEWRGLGVLFIRIWAHIPDWTLLLLCGVIIGLVRKRTYVFDALVLSLGFWAFIRVILVRAGFIEIEIDHYGKAKLLLMWAWDAIGIPVCVFGAWGAHRFKVWLQARTAVDAEGYLRCKGCGYSLRGLTEPRCPECGREFDAARPNGATGRDAGSKGTS